MTTDGVEALEFPRQRDEYEDAPRPNIALLELNLARKDCEEPPVQIRDDPGLETIQEFWLSVARLLPKRKS